MNINKNIISLFFALSIGSGSIGAAPFSNLTILGDSLSDIGASSSAALSIYNILGGNCDPAHPCPPYYDGRFSNGPVTVEYLADSILSGGVNSSNFQSYAIAGSTTGIGNYGDDGSVDSYGNFFLPGMDFQATFYLPSINTNSDALHVIWGGANDYLTGDSSTGAAQNIADFVERFATQGAKNILVPNLPDLSLTPFVQSQGSFVINGARDFSLEFNQALSGHLDDLSLLFPTTNIFQFDTFTLFNDIFQNPVAYGFVNTVDACVTLPDVCADSAEYLFWDDFHPTTQAHNIFAYAMTSSVPTPSFILFFATGLLSLFFAKNAKRGRMYL